MNLILQKQKKSNYFKMIENYKIKFINIIINYFIYIYLNKFIILFYNKIKITN